MRRLPSGALVTLLLLGLLAGCGDRREDLRELRAALERTDREGYKFVYREELLGAPPVEVRGAVEDDLRYRARLLLDGKPGMDEVVSDDSLASRFLSADALKLYLRPPGETPLSEKEAAAALAATAQIQAGKWVLDPTGAPPVVTPAGKRQSIGDDPVFDALNLLRYMDGVTRDTQAVRVFNEDDFDYKPKEDPFKKPDELYPGQKVKRYDFERFPLPKAADAAIGGNQVVPGPGSFRKAAVYVKDGLVIRVDEDVDVVSRLEDLQKNYNVELPPGDPDRAVAIAIKAINAVREGQGDPPIRVRKMTYILSDLGKKQDVELPAETVQGSLTLLRNRGRIAAAPPAAPAAAPAAASG